MLVLDGTIVNIALPAVQRDLGFADADRQWIITAYALAIGSLLLLGGRIIDTFGRKPTFIAGLIGFAVASALGGAAGSFTVLVVARALQGAFGAVLAPAALSLLSTTFTRPGERGRAFGVFGAVGGTGSAIGLLLGGALTEYASWRWCMYVNLVFIGIAVVGAVLLLPRQPAGAHTKLDLPGAVTVTVSLSALVYGFARAETAGWSAPVTLGCLGAGAAGLTVFVVIEARAANPLLPLRLLADRDRAGSFLAMFVVNVGMFGLFLFVTYYLQLTLRFRPVAAGLAFLPLVIALAASTQLLAPRLLTKAGPRTSVVAGLAIAAAGMAWLARLDVDSTYGADVLPPLIVFGAGFGIIVPTTMNTATLDVAAHDSGIASAAVNTVRQIGGSVGTALLSTLAAGATAGYLTDRTSTSTTGAQIHGYTTAFWWCAGLLAVAAVPCFVLLRRGVPAETDSSTPAVL